MSQVHNRKFSVLLCLTAEAPIKFKDGKFSEISGYCPLDFFSGNRNRMHHALRGLIKAPQHQLKICKNGKEVYGSEMRQDLSEILRVWFPQHTHSSEDLLSEFLDLVIEALLYSPRHGVPATVATQDKDTQDHTNHKSKAALLYSPRHGVPATVAAQDKDTQDHRNHESKAVERDTMSSSGDLFSMKVEGLTSESSKTAGSQICGNSPFYASSDNTVPEVCLPEGCVLESMSRLQQMDQLNMEDVFLLHSHLAKAMEADPQLRSLWRWDGPYSDVSWILGDNSAVADTMEDSVLKVKRFLVSKTLQDCSIIVALKPASKRQSNQETGHLLNFHENLFKFSVSIIDLDPKSFEKVPFYYHQAVDIASAFQDLTS